MPARLGLRLPPVDRWQVLIRYQQYRSGAPAKGLAPPPVQGQPGGLQSGTGQQPGRTWSARHPPPGGAVQQQGRGGRRGTIGGLRRSSFRAFAR